MQPRFKQVLEKIAAQKGPGPLKSFSVFHLVSALELLALETIGRGRLSEKLNVGEGAARTIISRLEDAGLISVSKKGCALTGKGSVLWRECQQVFARKAELGRDDLTIGEFNFGVLVKGYGSQVGSGIEQRDAAVKIGADSATTIVIERGKLMIPSVSSDVVKDFPKTAGTLLKVFKPEEGDVIVVSSAGSRQLAEFGVLAAAWTLLV
jgi:predicted transcriptional regulator